MSCPKVSVIIPIYNTEKYLEKCLGSIQNQSIKEIEIVCVNDGSTDGSLSILNKYAKADKRIKVITQKNSGAGMARNNGIKAATGKYISFIDADDWLDKDFLKNAYECAENSKADIVETTQSYNCYKNGKIVLFHKKRPMGFVGNGAYFRRDVIWDKIYRTDFIKNHDIFFLNGLCHNDAFFLLQSLYYRAKIVREDKAIYFHNKANENSIRYRMTDKKLLSMLDMFIAEIKFLNSHFFSFYDYKRNYDKLLHTAKLKRRYVKENDAAYREKLREIVSLYKYPSTLRILWKKATNSRFKEELKNSKATSDQYPEMLKKWYYKKLHKKLNLESPKTFNEKIQWLKLYDSTPEKTRLADKYLVRQYVKEKIGEEYLIPLLGVYSKFDEIDFDSLPNEFVLKCNHGSGMNVIITDKKAINRKKLKKKFDNWMRENFGFVKGLQLHYNNIPHKIIAEKYIGTASEYPDDFKVLCFNGEPKLIEYVTNRKKQAKANFFDTNWTPMNFKYHLPTSNSKIKKPDKLKEMLEKAKILSKGFKFVRVDLYLKKDQMYVGELTFTPGNGISKFPEDIDLKMGKWLKI